MVGRYSEEEQRSQRRGDGSEVGTPIGGGHLSTSEDARSSAGDRSGDLAAVPALRHDDCLALLGLARHAGQGRPIGRVLHAVESRVDATPREEIAVRPLLAQLALVQHEDAIRVLDGREAVGDHHRGAAAEELRERVLDQPLGLRIDARGRLVENEDGRIVGQCAGEGEELALASGEVAAPLADETAVTEASPFSDSA